MEQAESIADAPAVADHQNSSESMKPSSAAVQGLNWSRGERFVVYRKGRG